MNKKFLIIAFLLTLMSFAIAGNYVIGTIISQQEFNTNNFDDYDFAQNIIDKQIDDEALIVTFTIESFEKTDSNDYLVVDKNIVFTYWKDRYYNCRLTQSYEYCMAQVNKNILDRLDFAIQQEKELLNSWKNTTLFDDELLTIDTFYYDLPQYIIGKSYVVGDSFLYENVAYEVIQNHTSQSDWLPSKTHSLYKLKSLSVGNIVSDWVQPTGAHDAYNIGDRVLFNGQVYESLINANVWSPIVYPAGWRLI